MSPSCALYINAHCFDKLHVWEVNHSQTGAYAVIHFITPCVMMKPRWVQATVRLEYSCFKYQLPFLLNQAIMVEWYDWHTQVNVAGLTCVWEWIWYSCMRMTEDKYWHQSSGQRELLIVSDPCYVFSSIALCMRRVSAWSSFVHDKLHQSISKTRHYVAAQVIGPYLQSGSVCPWIYLGANKWTTKTPLIILTARHNNTYD